MQVTRTFDHIFNGNVTTIEVSADYDHRADVVNRIESVLIIKQKYIGGSIVVGDVQTIDITALAHEQFPAWIEELEQRNDWHIAYEEQKEAKAA